LTDSKRILNEPCWLLHHRPFRDSSQLLDILSRDHGRLTLVARGSRSSKSLLRGVLRPFMPLELSWAIRSDLGTLTAAETHGAPISHSGDALLAGYYVNELILHLQHRHDPQPDVFSAYRQVIEGLAGRHDMSACLREFEMSFLRILGYAPILDHDGQTQEPLLPDGSYEYRVEQGPVLAVAETGPGRYSGNLLGAIGRQEFTDQEVLQAAGRLLKFVIAHHLGGKELKSRKVLLELRRGARIRDNAGESNSAGSLP
jgi:DNA repair protein RecO (recombination protein O)